MVWTILIVDDDEALRQALGAVVRLICRDLARPGEPELILAASGQAAVDVCHRRQPDLVLMDVCMPGIDGIEAFYLIRDDNAGIPARTVFLTGYAGSRDLRERLDRAVADGALGYVCKPLTRDDLADVIECHAPHP